jgi:hypothetical protein
MNRRVKPPQMLAMVGLVIAMGSVAWPHASGAVEPSAAEVLARARDVRRLARVDRGFASGRSLTVVYDYSPTWQADASGTLEIEFTPPATVRRLEHFPWQRFHTSESTVGPGAFRRWFRDDGPVRDASTAAAARNARAVALADSIILLHRLPTWAAVSLRVSETTPAHTTIVASSSTWRAELRFARDSGLLERVIQGPPDGESAARSAPTSRDVVHEMTDVSNYRMENGVLFPGALTRRFRGGPATVDGQGFDGRLRRVDF